MTMNKKIVSLIAVLVAIGAVAIFYFGWPSSFGKPEITPGENEPVFCTADAMQCPDGTWVGRTGPNCEFVCPGD
jgi:hypothetical protein